MLLHRNSCLLLFIKMGQTVEITLGGGTGGGDTTPKPGGYFKNHAYQVFCF